MGTVINNNGARNNAKTQQFAVQREIDTSHENQLQFRIKYQTDKIQAAQRTNARERTLVHSQTILTSAVSKFNLEI